MALMPINSLQDLLTIRELKNQANPTYSAIKALADGVALGIQKQQEEARKAKEEEETFNRDFERAKKINSTNSGRIGDLTGSASIKDGKLSYEFKQKDIYADLKEKRLAKEQELRDFRNDFNSRMELGLPISDNEIPRINQNLGTDFKKLLESGRGVPYYDENTGERKWRVKSQKEFEQDITNQKWDSSEIEHLNKINDEYISWKNVEQRLSTIGISKDKVAELGQIQFKTVNSPMGPISLPAKFNLYGQYAQDPKYTAIKADIESAFQSFRIRVTGAQASDKELKNLRPVIASLKDNPAVFFARLENQMANLEDAYNGRLSMYQNAGRKVDNFIGKLGNKNIGLSDNNESSSELKTKNTTNFNSIEEAESANLPKGTIIYINGRKAVVE